jgi:putative membrane protein insertion efficiency factor
MPLKEAFKLRVSGEVNHLRKVGSINILTVFEWGVGRILIILVRVYQHTLRSIFPPSCRFSPSCSEYAIGALKKFGALKGGWLSVKRLARCHPFNPGGYDPIP